MPPGSLLTDPLSGPSLNRMEVNFTPEQESRLHQVATRTGKDPRQVVEEGIDRMLDYDERFLAAVEEGRASARRGDLLEHDEVVERIERMFHP
jgi:predicted transcriptional regulator